MALELSPTTVHTHSRGRRRSRPPIILGALLDRPSRLSDSAHSLSSARASQRSFNMLYYDPRFQFCSFVGGRHRRNRIFLTYFERTCRTGSATNALIWCWTLYYHMMILKTSFFTSCALKGHHFLTKSSYTTSDFVVESVLFVATNSLSHTRIICSIHQSIERLIVVKQNRTMTAAVMGMPTSSRYGVAFGESTITKRSPDLIERFFSGFEGVFCAPRSVEALSKEVVEEPVLLDYVFDHVESFTCATDDLSYQNDPFLLTPTRGHHHGFPEDGSKTDSYDFALKRENSLLEQGPNGAPSFMVTTRQPARIAACGTEGDVLDYCFEHVESFVCNNSEPEERGYSNSKSGKSSRTPTRNTTNNQRRQQASPEPSHPIPRVISTPRKRKKKRRNRQKQNYFPDEEDSILLFFRPKKSADV